MKHFFIKILMLSLAFVSTGTKATWDEDPLADTLDQPLERDLDKLQISNMKESLRSGALCTIISVGFFAIYFGLLAFLPNDQDPISIQEARLISIIGGFLLHSFSAISSGFIYRYLQEHSGHSLESKKLSIGRGLVSGVLFSAMFIPSSFFFSGDEGMILLACLDVSRTCHLLLFPQAVIASAVSLVSNQGVTLGQGIGFASKKMYKKLRRYCEKENERLAYKLMMRNASSSDYSSL